MEKILFRDVSYDDLKKYFDISQVYPFVFKSDVDLVSDDEREFLSSLITKHQNYIDDYSEEELKMLFVAPILNRVSFRCADVREWFERDLSLEFDDVILSGKTDFMLARGFSKPQEPFFFIQEYKRSFPNSNPKWQLLSEMIVAIHLQDSDEIVGTYIVGQHWSFMKLFKDGDKLTFSISQSLDSLDIEEMMAIYQNLKAIKKIYCEGIK